MGLRPMRPLPSPDSSVHAGWTRFSGSGFNVSAPSLRPLFARHRLLTGIGGRLPEATQRAAKIQDVIFTTKRRSNVMVNSSLGIIPGNRPRKKPIELARYKSDYPLIPTAAVYNSKAAEQTESSAKSGARVPSRTERSLGK
jgi:hypothetical protein